MTFDREETAGICCRGDEVDDTAWELFRGDRDAQHQI